MKKFALGLALIVTATGSYAAGCGKPRNAFDQVYCAGNLFSQKDNDLNKAYTSLRQQLDSGQKESLKQGQLAWIKSRDAACSKEDSSGYFVNLDCAVDKTQARLDFLKERERECKSTGCSNDKLAK
ncbi:lysozyme inhibitor LprI family protein [Uliginosibacterium sp. H3]|uniref:Lysozyme inhibitor LprI family protein n=1 Tax=Uliginosibacterium silvisoli TaxID=3114758 RepID=A0ABU6JZX6_9RHOO|nr:lysozyme inhibitor LprI family protein [Uliginosibacterium sp. H3]